MTKVGQLADYESEAMFKLKVVVRYSKDVTAVCVYELENGNREVEQVLCMYNSTEAVSSIH